MSTTRRLLLPWLLARLGARAFKAPRLSVRHREAVGAAVRRPLACLRSVRWGGIGQLGAVQPAKCGQEPLPEFAPGVPARGEHTVHAADPLNSSSALRRAISCPVRESQLHQQ